MAGYAEVYGQQSNNGAVTSGKERCHTWQHFWYTLSLSHTGIIQSLGSLYRQHGSPFTITSTIVRLCSTYGLLASYTVHITGQALHADTGSLLEQRVRMYRHSAHCTDNTTHHSQLHPLLYGYVVPMVSSPPTRITFGAASEDVSVAASRSCNCPLLSCQSLGSLYRQHDSPFTITSTIVRLCSTYGLLASYTVHITGQALHADTGSLLEQRVRMYRHSAHCTDNTAHHSQLHPLLYGYVVPMVSSPPTRITFGAASEDVSVAASRSCNCPLLSCQSLGSLYRQHGSPFTITSTIVRLCSTYGLLASYTVHITGQALHADTGSLLEQRVRMYRHSAHCTDNTTHHSQLHPLLYGYVVPMVSSPPTRITFGAASEDVSVAASRSCNCPLLSCQSLGSLYRQHDSPFTITSTIVRLCSTYGLLASYTVHITGQALHADTGSLLEQRVRMYR
ncbi:hypothetical protein J6590_001268 [Homalodisca vitripennis]|nr:hypothetical protein J6590_001268 [Homalodisca vitripennis]